MPRPCKRRRICALPRCRRFGPLEGGAAGPGVRMTVDEFEAIRLIDGEGLTQEACAAQMDVARATIQAIYASARQKLARCLVEGRAMCIEGGAYEVCPRASADCGRCRCACSGKEREREHESCSHL